MSPTGARAREFGLDDCLLYVRVKAFEGLSNPFYLPIYLNFKILVELTTLFFSDLRHLYFLPVTFMITFVM